MEVTIDFLDWEIFKYSKIPVVQHAMTDYQILLYLFNKIEKERLIKVQQ